MIWENRIREVRIRKGLTKKQLAIKTGLHVNTISRAEKNEVITVDTLIRISRALGISMDDLFF